MKNWIVLLVFLSVAGFLLLKGLGNNVYWDDEAQTAFFARTIMKSGLPVAWDGKNLFGSHDGWPLNKDLINRLSPWLQYYIVALSFGLLGATTFSGRIPFVIVGMATVALTYLFARRYTNDDWGAFFSALLLVLSPSFLLFSRQSHYYSLIMFAALLCLWAYTSISGRGYREIVRLSLAFTLLFYSNYLTFFSFAGALLITSLFTLRDFAKWRSILISLTLSLLLAAPWFLYTRPYEVYSPMPSLGSKLSSDIVILWWYFRDLNRNSFFPLVYLFLLPLILFRKRTEMEPKEMHEKRRFKLNRSNVFLLLTTLFSILLLVFLSSQPQGMTVVANIRFASYLIPLFCLIMGIIISRIWKRTRIMALALLFITIFTNLGTFQRFRPFFLEYLYEITHDYVTPYEAVIHFLDENASEGDTVLVRPEYCTYPLVFYLGDRLRFCCILKESNINLTLDPWKKLPPYVYKSRIAPDWIIKFSSPPREWLKYMDRRLWWGEMVPDSVLEYIKESGISYSSHQLDVFSRDGTRPELIHHYFKPPREFPRYMNIFIFEKLGQDRD